jgi:hypothetical protein
MNLDYAVHSHPNKAFFIQPTRCKLSNQKSLRNWRCDSSTRVGTCLIVLLEVGLQWNTLDYSVINRSISRSHRVVCFGNINEAKDRSGLSAQIAPPRNDNATSNYSVEKG